MRYFTRREIEHSPGEFETIATVVGVCDQAFLDLANAPAGATTVVSPGPDSASYAIDPAIKAVYLGGRCRSNRGVRFACEQCPRDDISDLDLTRVYSVDREADGFSIRSTAAPTTPTRTKPTGTGMEWATPARRPARPLTRSAAGARQSSEWRSAEAWRRNYDELQGIGSTCLL